jgi:hypothetical protein
MRPISKRTVTIAFIAVNDILTFGAEARFALTAGWDELVWVISFPQNAQKTRLSGFCLPQ